MLRGVTVSERAFETYLNARNYGPWRYEELPPGITRPADYSLALGGVTVRFEVKEWEPVDPVGGVTAFDPYEPVRAKIREAKVKFREYRGRGEACCLVVGHHGPQLIILDRLTIFGAMRGDFGWVFPLALGDAPVGFGDEGHEAFLRDGEMVRGKNTTISAIVVISTIDVRHRKVRLEMKRRELAKGAPFTLDERFNLAGELYEAAGPEHVEFRVQVYDNVEATVPLPADFPTGPLDERYGRMGDVLTRVFAGPDLVAFEQQEGALLMERDD